MAATASSDGTTQDAPTVEVVKSDDVGGDAGGVVGQGASLVNYGARLDNLYSI
jgi:hypothetical protein